MAKPRDINARRYYRAAYQRMDDGEVLFRNDKLVGAIYITGYAVECMLKALLIEQTAPNQRLNTEKTFRGSRAHSYDWLIGELKRLNIELPTPIRREISFLNYWSTDLRYQASKGSVGDAEQFMRSTQKVIIWIEQRI